MIFPNRAQVKDRRNFQHVNKLEKLSREELHQCKRFTARSYCAGSVEHANQSGTTYQIIIAPRFAGSSLYNEKTL